MPLDPGAFVPWYKLVQGRNKLVHMQCLFATDAQIPHTCGIRHHTELHEQGKKVLLADFKVFCLGLVLGAFKMFFFVSAHFKILENNEKCMQ